MLDETTMSFRQTREPRAEFGAFQSGKGASDVFGKRGFDAIVSTILLVLSAPLLLVAMAAVKLTSRGPVIYTQTRLGRDRRTFTIYKVRTMYHDCERLTGPCWSTEDDPRITRVGRLLRRTHLDELPQLWNVLRGDMSLVGPRPERPEIARHLEAAIPRYADRLAVPPGLTGLAQMRLPADTDLESVRRKLVLDLQYIERAGPLLDLRIVAGTAFFVLGVPFPVSCRCLGLLERSERENETESETETDPARRARPRDGVELVSPAQPAWRDS